MIIKDVEVSTAFLTNSVSTVSPWFFKGKKIIELINHCTLENLLISLQTKLRGSKPTSENTKDNYCHFKNYLLYGCKLKIRYLL